MINIDNLEEEVVVAEAVAEVVAVEVVAVVVTTQEAPENHSPLN
jgi:hypothetical protein